MKQKNSFSKAPLSKRAVWSLMELTVNDPPKHSFVVSDRTWFAIARELKMNPIARNNYSFPLYILDHSVYRQPLGTDKSIIEDWTVLYLSATCKKIVEYSLV